MEERELRHKYSHQGWTDLTANTMTTPFSWSYLHVGKGGAVTVCCCMWGVFFLSSHLNTPSLNHQLDPGKAVAQGKPRPVVCHVHSPTSAARAEPGDKLLVLGAAHSTNWEVQTRGKNAHFKGRMTCGRKQMSFQCTVKHALVQSQQVLNVVFSVVPSSSPRIHRVAPPSCCTQSHPCLPCSSHSICMCNFWCL